jgi:hypothetical protein
MAHSQSTILDASTNRVISANLLEMKRGMKRVSLQKLEILVLGVRPRIETI